ncbi:MAG: Ig-like domain-containing protein, partial [Clostridia bacterium]|nr:Ig-like domain-containing protein [Clostridia bacterium]
NKNVTWSSKNDNIASVNSRGVVTANAAGTTKITATTVNGKSAYCTVTVIGEETPDPVDPDPQDPTEPEDPEEPVVSSASVAAAYVKAYQEKNAEGNPSFSLNLKDSSRVATLQVTLETDGTNLEVVGKNGFTCIGKADESTSAGKYTATYVLCYLQGDEKQLTKAGELVIADMSVEGSKPSVAIKDMKISGWNSEDEVAYGTIADIDNEEVVFTGKKSYDLNQDGNINLLDINIAQGFYQAAKGDNNWKLAEKCDFNNDNKVDVEDFIMIMLQFGH